MPKAKIFEFAALVALCCSLPAGVIAQSPSPTKPGATGPDATGPKPAGPQPAVPVAAAPAGTAQTSMGQLIEQVKRNKLNELLPAPAMAGPAQPASDSALPFAPAVAAPPVLWSLSGVNDQLVAEVLVEESIHRFRVARGQTLPGGWTVMAGDLSSITLQQGRKVLTLFAPDPGSTGAEFAVLRRQIEDANPMSALQSSLNRRGIPVQFIDSPPVSRPSAGVEQARSAAGSLPRKP